jgi:hypothetical protein
MTSYPEPTAETQLQEDLQNHLALCRKTLELAEFENRAFRVEGTFHRHEIDQIRQELLPALTRSVEKLRTQRLARQGSSSGRLGAQSQALLRQGQDLMMKIILLDRENEQAMLRGGLIPASQLPSFNRQRPHFVSDCYQRSTGTQG